MFLIKSSIKSFFHKIQKKKKKQNFNFWEVFYKFYGMFYFFSKICFTLRVFSKITINQFINNQTQQRKIYIKLININYTTTLNSNLLKFEFFFN